MPTTRLMFALSMLVAFNATAQGLAPLEAYGALPTTELVTISPSGKHLAFRTTRDGKNAVLVVDLEQKNRVGGVDLGDLDPRELVFADDESLILVAGRTMRSFGVRDQFDYSTAFILDIASGKVRKLLRDDRNIWKAQSGLGEIVGQSPDGKHIYMPAFHAEARQDANPRYGLFEVGIDRKHTRLVADGRHHTTDWFVDQMGEPIVRVDYMNAEHLYQVWALNGKHRVIFEKETNLRLTGPVGLMPDRDALVFVAINSDDEVRAYYRLSIDDGEMTGPILQRDDIGVAHVLTDVNRVVHGVKYEGFKPRYSFFDESLDRRMAAIQTELYDTSVTLVSWSTGFRDLIVYISGGWHAGAYLLFANGAEAPEIIAESRPDIASEQVVPTSIMNYIARDGVEIPALLTARPEVLSRGVASLIVMPHGGPASNDEFSFDWLAQYFASRGYVVLQPQFRGSTGFGTGFKLSGRGEWGRKMLWDLDDGVDKMVEDGVIDPGHVCIVGQSYGGYAALAAGAFSADKYRCIAAIAPVADLRRMLQDDKQSAGRNHWVVRYWEAQVGVDRYEWKDLDAISPAHHAGNFNAPVLLVHGDRDTVVPISQSRRMKKALRDAGKNVTLVELDGDDHWLSRGETRIESLSALARFVEANLAVQPGETD